MAFASIHPFGEERADLRAGIVAAATANCWRDRKASPLKPQDFMPEFTPRKAQTVSQQIEMGRRIAAMFGGVIK